MDHDSQVAIIGAGPYGLACAAFLRHSGFEPRVFGEPMGFWRKHMPRGMLLRSRRCSSHIADPRLALTIDEYEENTGAKLSEPIDFESTSSMPTGSAGTSPPMSSVDVSSRSIASMGLHPTLEDGEAIGAHGSWSRPGSSRFPGGHRRWASCRRIWSRIPPTTRSSRPSGKRVMVIGAGQSALESAAILHEAGADVEIVTRGPGIVWLAPEGAANVLRACGATDDAADRRRRHGTGWMAAAPDLLGRMPSGCGPRSRGLHRSHGSGLVASSAGGRADGWAGPSPRRLRPGQGSASFSTMEPFAIPITSCSARFSRGRRQVPVPFA